MVVFFPFEVPIYKAAGVDVEWVGHPLLDIVRPSLSRKRLSKNSISSPEHPIVALLPGSRESEIHTALYPLLLASAELLQREIPTLQFVIPLASGMSRGRDFAMGSKSPIPVKVVEGLTYDVMNVADLLITASGTATLEGAILRKAHGDRIQSFSLVVPDWKNVRSSGPHRNGQSRCSKRVDARIAPERRHPGKNRR